MAIFDVGTKTIFQQTSAPTGWTKETVNYNDHALKIVNGATLSSGGTVDFTTAFSSTPYRYSAIALQHTVGSTTLSVAQLPGHNHNITPSVNRIGIGAAITSNPVAPAPVSIAPTAVSSFTSPSLSGGLSHDHSIDILASGNVFTNDPTATLNVNYVDIIIATLN